MAQFRHKRVAPPGAGRGSGTLPISCGTLVVNGKGEILLCHVTHTPRWDIPKGMRDEGEDTLTAAMRELQEEAGVAFAPSRFIDLGQFDYRRDKRLHLYLVSAGEELGDLSRLTCTSFFPDPMTGQPTPETDGFRWASRAELTALCWPRMGQLLTGLPWPDAGS